MARCRDEGVVFTCTPVSTAWVYFNDDFDNHPIKQMGEFGLKISLDCDDPPMFKTDPTKDMVMAHEHMGFEVEDFRQCMLNGIDGAWLDEPDKRTMRRAWASARDVDVDVEGAGATAADAGLRPSVSGGLDCTICWRRSMVARRSSARCWRWLSSSARCRSFSPAWACRCRTRASSRQAFSAKRWRHSARSRSNRASMACRSASRRCRGPRSTACARLSRGDKARQAARTQVARGGMVRSTRCRHHAAPAPGTRPSASRPGVTPCAGTRATAGPRCTALRPVRQPTSPASRAGRTARPPAR